MINSRPAGYVPVGALPRTERVPWRLAASLPAARRDSRVSCAELSAV